MDKSTIREQKITVIIWDKLQIPTGSKSPLLIKSQ